MSNLEDDAWVVNPRRTEWSTGKGTGRRPRGRPAASILAVVWFFGIGLLFGLWYWVGWWVLILAALGVWASIDYLTRGDQGGVADRAKRGM